MPSVIKVEDTEASKISLERTINNNGDEMSIIDASTEEEEETHGEGNKSNYKYAYIKKLPTKKASIADKYCDKCDRTYTSIYTLRNHNAVFLQIFYARPQRNNSTYSTPDINDPNSVCRVCDKKAMVIISIASI